MPDAAITLSNARRISSIFSRFETSDSRFAITWVVLANTSEIILSLFISRVVPDDVRSAIASATPSCGAASQAPATSTIVTSTPAALKKSSQMFGNSVAIRMPFMSETSRTADASGTAKTNRAPPNFKSKIGSTSALLSAIMSRPVIPMSATPFATYSGISIGRTKRISMFGSTVFATSWREAVIFTWIPAFVIKSLIGSAILPLFGIARRTFVILEGL